ncbi:MAG: DUF6714 family protein [Phycisphaerae bacterium]
METRTDLISKIAEAFPEERRFDGIVVRHDCIECRRVDALYRGKRWSELHAEDLEREPAAYSLFSPEAYVCFLPALLIAAIREPSFNNIVDVERLVRVVSEDCESASLTLFRERYPLLSKRQRSTVGLVLRYLSESSRGDSGILCPGPLVDRAIAELWS